MAVADDGRIFVLAGPNGAGKSSVGGSAWRAAGADYFNPDEYARQLLERAPELTQSAANGRAWQKGRQYLERAIRENSPFAFETTLGGSTIPGLLRDAALQGRNITIWYVALESVEMHIDRVSRRVREGGHPIADDVIRSRYDTSRANLAALLPLVHEVIVFDNSRDAPNDAPLPIEIVRVVDGEIVHMLPAPHVPVWAKPIVAAALAARTRLS